MSFLYYPYYQLEKYYQLEDNLKNFKNENHKANINVLSLFCTNILIPCRHILTISHSNYDILSKYKSLFQRNILYCRLPNNMSNLLEYYENNKDQLNGMNLNLIENRAKELNDSISNNRTKELNDSISNNRAKELNDSISNNRAKYNPEYQQGNYSDNIRKAFSFYSKKHPRFHSCIEIQQKFNDENIMTKEKFDNVIGGLYKKHYLKKEHYINLLTISNILYFVGGVSNSKLKICFDEYFENEDNKKIIYGIVNNYDEIFCRDYQPIKIIEVLKEIGVLANAKDINLLNAEDIIELRSVCVFQKFVEKYCRKASNNKALDYLRKQKRIIPYIQSIKNNLISLIISIISTIISYFFIQSLLISIIICIITFLLSALIIRIVNNTNFKIKFISDFSDKIIGLIAPDVLFLYKIQQKIKKLSEY